MCTDRDANFNKTSEKQILDDPISVLGQDGRHEQMERGLKKLICVQVPSAYKCHCNTWIAISFQNKAITWPGCPWNFKKFFHRSCGIEKVEQTNKERWWHRTWKSPVTQQLQRTSHIVLPFWFIYPFIDRNNYGKSSRTTAQHPCRPSHCYDLRWKIFHTFVWDLLKALKKRCKPCTIGLWAVALSSSRPSLRKRLSHLYQSR